ncbi:MAG TPA: DivIVA domain-containing protein [Rhodothermales bacterium]
MKLTPLDIRKQEFSRRVRGVDEEEVKAFLQMVASQWEEIQDEQRRIEDKVRDLEGKLEHYKRVEEALQEALRTARENAREALDTARQKAQVILQEAEANAVHIKRDADDERRKMKRQIARLSHRRDEIVSRLRAFLMSEMEMLARFEGDDAVGFIKLMPSQEKQLQESTEALNADVEESAPVELEHPEPVSEPEEEPAPVADAPLPAWAQFAETDEVEPAPAEPEAEIPEPVAFDERQEPAPVKAPSFAAPSFVTKATDHTASAPESESQSVESGFDLTPAAANAWTPEPHYEDEPAQALSRFDASDEHVDEEPENEPEPVGAPAEGPGMSRWLNDRLFSAFKARGNSGDGTVSAPAPTEQEAWEEQTPEPAEYEAPQASADEEEESFTVSSEEVERIRRILKGLD